MFRLATQPAGPPFSVTRTLEGQTVVFYINPCAGGTSLRWRYNPTLVVLNPLTLTPVVDKLVRRLSSGSDWRHCLAMFTANWIGTFVNKDTTSNETIISSVWRISWVIDDAKSEEFLMWCFHFPISGFNSAVRRLYCGNAVVEILYSRLKKCLSETAEYESVKKHLISCWAEHLSKSCCWQVWC